MAIVLMVGGAFIKVINGQIDIVSVPLNSIFSNELALGDHLMGLGIFVLAMTPALRVLLLISLWFKERDWKFVGVGALVILALIISLLLGGH